jgi:hypothetical protein
VAVISALRLPAAQSIRQPLSPLLLSPLPLSALEPLEPRQVRASRQAQTASAAGLAAV